MIICVSQTMSLEYAADIELVERRNRLWQRSRSLFVSRLPKKVRKQSCGVTEGATPLKDRSKERPEWPGFAHFSHYVSHGWLD